MSPPGKPKVGGPKNFFARSAREFVPPTFKIVAPPLGVDRRLRVTEMWWCPPAECYRHGVQQPWWSPDTDCWKPDRRHQHYLGACIHYRRGNL